MSRSISLVMLFFCLGSLSGCAVMSPYEEANDPLEPVNRAIYKFNDGLDRVVLKPVAEGYQEYIPSLARHGVRNFFNNLLEPVTIVNQLLQGKPVLALQDTMRFTFNSIFGLAGLMDVSTGWELPRHEENFGQTFGVWGFGDGWYLMLPVLGPSSIRDTAGLPLSFELEPITRVGSGLTRAAYYGLNVVSKRADLLGASKVLDAAALDPYVQVREAYRQKVWFDLHDGDPPEPDFFDDELFLEE